MTIDEILFCIGSVNRDEAVERLKMEIRASEEQDEADRRDREELLAEEQAKG